MPVDPHAELDPAIASVEGRKCLSIWYYATVRNKEMLHPDAHPVLRLEYERGELVKGDRGWCYVRRP